MLVKARDYQRTTLSRFDLLGHDEKGLAKAFAYLLASERAVLFALLHSLGIGVNNTDGNLSNITIATERRRAEGRTDIEIELQGRFHLIIECKIGTNRLKAQRAQYLPSFDSSVAHNVLCFITEERDYNRSATTGVDIHYISWADIIDLVDMPAFNDRPIVREFVSFAAKGFTVRRQREVLIQDLSASTEVKRYVNHQVYRRDVTFGSPLYFAPYFTRAARESHTDIGQGISSLSRVLGVLTVRGKDVKSFSDELRAFAQAQEKDSTERDSLVARWLGGVDKGSDTEFTYYFLGSPIQVSPPLLKDGGIEQGRGKNWIAGKIPKNRCVTFGEFTRRMSMQAEASAHDSQRAAEE